MRIQTKSTLVLRDLDLLKRFSKCEVGFTITSIDDKVRELYEPKSSSFKDKLDAICEFSNNGVKTWVFLGPIMPHITDKKDNLENLMGKLQQNVDFILIDKLRLKKGLFKNIEYFLSEYNPELIEVYKEILFSNNNYFSEVKSKIVRLCCEYNINHEVLF